MSKQFYRILSGFAVLSLLLVSCAAPSSGTAGSDGNAGAAAKVQVTMWADADADADCFVDVVQKGFNAQSDSVELVRLICAS